jgi:hypothetical protein
MDEIIPVIKDNNEFVAVMYDCGMNCCETDTIEFTDDRMIIGILKYLRDC